MADKDLNYADDEMPTDNQGFLPGWFTALLIGPVIFSVVFAGYMHGMAGWSQEKQYAEEVALFEQLHPQQTAKLNDDGSNPFRGDAAAIAAGEKTFKTICAACHKADMTGLVGPSLADTTWLHGNTDKELFNVVMNGVDADHLKQNPPKGPMPAHKTSLGAKGVLQVLAFVASKNPSLKAE